MSTPFQISIIRAKIWVLRFPTHIRQGKRRYQGRNKELLFKTFVNLINYSL